MWNEHHNIEWKSIWKDEYLKWLCGFANANGGRLYIGVDDKGKVVGIENHKKLLEDLPNKIRDVLGIMVEVNLHERDGKEYLELITEPYTTPISYRGKYYYRSGSTLQELKGPALEKMLLKKMGKKWDGVEAYGFEMNDLSSFAFEIFRKKAKRSKRIPLEDLNDTDGNLLELLGLKVGNQLKRAAIISFGKNPERLVTGAYVKIGFFRTHTDLLYQDEIHGSLFEQVEKTMDLLLTKYMRANIAYEGLTRTETYDYPEDALREALLNALIHKDYTSGSPIQISVYADTLMIYNSGELPQNWTIDNFKVKHKSEPANPDIANAFFRAGYIEVWGRGTLNILDFCKKAGLPEPEFEYDSGVTTIFKIRESQGIIEKDLEKDLEKDNSEMLIGSEKKIFQAITKNPKITNQELSGLIGINPRNIRKNIEKLKQKKMLKRIGPDRGGHWEIVEME
jgi:ATP-dependent DNA helicase RecG